MLFVTFAVTPHFLLFPILSYPWKYCVEFRSSKSFPYKLSQTLSSFTKGTNPNPNLRTSYYCDRYLFCHFLNQLTFYFFILHVCKLIKKKSHSDFKNIRSWALFASHIQHPIISHCSALTDHGLKQSDKQDC